MKLLVTLGFEAILVGVLAAACSPAPEPSAGEHSAEARQGLGAERTYLVLYKSLGVPANADAKIAAAGGQVVQAYDPIGVVIAKSTSSSFAANVLADNRVEGVSSTDEFATTGGDDQAQMSPAGPAPAPVIGGDNLSYLQWDMDQIKVPEARAITGGSPSVIVADLDTGADWRHPDLAPNIDFSRSVSCIGGVPNQDPAAWNDDHGHGTHTAGTIAAAANGVGIIGVAPNVKLAVVKVGNSDNLFFPPDVICGFMWIATHDVRVANNSYYVDPWNFNCRNDPEQRAIWKSVQRAVKYAQSKGVLVVGTAGNENWDVAHPTVDDTSPDYPPPDPEITRDVNNACVIVPGELPGVVTVGATGILGLKAVYSSYGLGYVNVVAPGGDSISQATPAPANGRVLSTSPAFLPAHVEDCSVQPCARYRYRQGTSMAAPHVTGIAALILSQDPNASSGAVAARIKNTADAIACPQNPYVPHPDFVATCTGGVPKNSFYGSGQVNALSALQ